MKVKTEEVAGGGRAEVHAALLARGGNRTGEKGFRGNKSIFFLLRALSKDPKRTSFAALSVLFYRSVSKKGCSLVPLISAFTEWREPLGATRNCSRWDQRKEAKSRKFLYLQYSSGCKNASTNDAAEWRKGRRQLLSVVSLSNLSKFLAFSVCSFEKKAKSVSGEIGVWSSWLNHWRLHCPNQCEWWVRKKHPVLPQSVAWTYY